jgi:hypothetical protein
MMGNNICSSFPITDSEYQCLEKEFGSLAKYASWQLLKKNTKNNHTDEFEDVNQELSMSLIRAGSYYKRQVYIEKCFEIAKVTTKDVFLKFVLGELEELWNNKTHHGANRQVYGEFQEQILENIIKKIVPQDQQPNKEAPLKIDEKFTTYCKAIVWNMQKSLGKKITREKSIRAGTSSLSEYDHLSLNTKEEW